MLPGAPQVQVEEFPNGVRYRLPRRWNRGQRLHVAAMLALGGLLSGFTLLCLGVAVRDLLAGHWHPSPIDLAGAGLLIPLFLFLGGGLFWNAWRRSTGWTLLEARGGYLRSTERGVPLPWRRAVLVKEVVELRLLPRAARGATTGDNRAFYGDVAPELTDLRAARRRGRPVALLNDYPLSIAAAVARDLARRHALPAPELPLAAGLPGWDGTRRRDAPLEESEPLQPVGEFLSPEGTSLPLRGRRARRLGEWLTFIVWNVVCWPLLLVFLYGYASGQLSDLEPPLLAFLLAMLVLLAILALAGVAIPAVRLLRRMRGDCLETPALVLSVHPLRLGEPFEVEFRQRTRRALTLRQLTLRLVCREQAVRMSNRGLHPRQHETHAQAHELARETTFVAGEAVTARLSFEIPGDAMHSFHGAWNQVKWLLEVRARLRGERDYTQEFRLHVLPERASN